MIVKGAEKIISGEYESTTIEGIKNAILESYDSSKYSILDVPKLAEQVIEAQINGDTKHYNKQKANMLEKYGGDTKEVKKQLNRTLGEMYKEGKIDRTQATRFMRNTLTMNQKTSTRNSRVGKNRKKPKKMNNILGERLRLLPLL
jgi:polyhydroxyalkanoate synthesis regulator phasin